MTEQINNAELLALTTEIVSAHASNNSLSAIELSDVIRGVHSTLADVSKSYDKKAGRPEPAVSVKKSITDDYIICLEDGKKLKMLKRHLKTAYGMSVEEYRERWGLGPDYPLVAPNYAKQRSQLAKSIGLGTRARKGNSNDNATRKSA